MKSFFFFLFFTNTIISQNLIIGKVQDSNRNPIQNANIVIYENDKTINKYTLTNSNGFFKFDLKSNEDKIKIKINHISFNQKELYILNKPQEIEIILTEKSFELKEVLIKNNPIKFNKDTLSYNVNSFKELKDRVIGDVLKKMPGIDVLNNGTITYQGKPIQKYYIDGLDLLEGKYNLANENIPIDAVSKVEIIENHQPIKILENISFNDRSSLNIKLKKKITSTGNANIGLGFGSENWDNNFTQMFFSKKQQLIASYQLNNTGKNIGNQLNVLTIENLNDLDFLEKKNIDLLSITKPANPPLKENIWLDNNTHLFTFNYLKKTHNNLELKLGASYLNDFQKQSSNTSTFIYTNNQNILFNELNKNRIFFNQLNSNFSLVKNTTNIYLVNELKLNNLWDNKNSSIFNLKEITETNTNFSTNFENKAKLIFKIKKNLLNFNSLINYSKDKESLLVTPGVFENIINNNTIYDNSEQNVANSNFKTKNSISFITSLKEIKIEPKIGFQINNKKLSSSLSNSQNNSPVFLNQIEANNAEAFSNISFTYKSDFWNFYITNNFLYKSLNTTDNIYNKTISFNKFLLEPGIYIVNNITPFWKISLNLNSNNSFGDLDNIYPNFILSNYKTIQKNNLKLLHSKNKNARITLSFRDPIKAFFFNANYIVKFETRNILYNNLYNTNGSIFLNAIDLENNIKNQTLELSFSKYLSSLRTNLNLKNTFNQIDSNQFSNDLIQKIRNNNYKINSEINFKLNDKFSFNYKPSFTFFYASYTNTSNFSTQEHLFNFSFYPKKTQYLGIEYNYYKTNTINTPHFLSAVYRYTLEKPKLDLELNFRNILENNIYTTTNYINNILVVSNYNLRPFQVLISTSFKF